MKEEHENLCRAIVIRLLEFMKPASGPFGWSSHPVFTFTDDERRAMEEIAHGE